MGRGLCQALIGLLLLQATAAMASSLGLLRTPGATGGKRRGAGSCTVSDWPSYCCSVS
jgi:hypothetical protein